MYHLWTETIVLALQLLQLPASTPTHMAYIISYTYFNESRFFLCHRTNVCKGFEENIEMNEIPI